VEAGEDEDRWKVPYLDMAGKGRRRRAVALAPAMCGEVNRTVAFF
jgi:hypothetical protein